MAADRPLLVFISDIHLTDDLQGGRIPRHQLFERFWERIRARRGARPAQLCFAGDLFDIVRSPSWFSTPLRPYHPASLALAEHVDRIVARILEREARFFAAIRDRVEAGELEVTYLLGNHDRLLREAPEARRRIQRALTGIDAPIEFESERLFPEHAVLAYHGHVTDVVNTSPDQGPTLGDAIGSELIVRFPLEVRRRVEEVIPELDDIDDVRPIYAVPAWVRRLGTTQRSLMAPVASSWVLLVEEFLSNPFVLDWMRDRRRPMGFDTGKSLRLMLELSTSRLMAKGHDRRLTTLYRVLQHSFDGKMARHAAQRLEQVAGGHARFVVNGHSHFASMVPLGQVAGQPAVYFNTGTWRTVHQIGHDLGGRPSFLPYDAMSYLVFFPRSDHLGRDYEWWTGVSVAQSTDAP